MDVHDLSRLSVVVTGAHQHAFGDMTPIELRSSALIASTDLPVTRLACVDKATRLDLSGVFRPRAVLIQNLAGANLPTIPDEAAANELARKVLLIGLSHSAEPAVAQLTLAICPAKPAQSPGQGQFLWLDDEVTSERVHVFVCPRTVGLSIPIRYIVFPGPQAD